MTDHTSSAVVAGFYDRLAGDYDRMTGLDKRFISEKPFFRLLVETHGIKTAIDAGAGTGFHSLLLSQLGVRVTAVDISRKMLAALRQNAERMGLSVKTVESPFQDLPDRIPEKVDALFCLGNSLPHLLDEAGLGSSLKAFYTLLRPGGWIFLHLLNYEKILSLHERVLNVKEDGDSIFVRFYDYGESALRFNILTLTRHASGWDSALEGVNLHAWTSEEIADGLVNAGFTKPRLFGGISMEPFLPQTSKDLVLTAMKNT